MAFAKRESAGAHLSLTIEWERKPATFNFLRDISDRLLTGGGDLFEKAGQRGKTGYGHYRRIKKPPIILEL